MSEADSAMLRRAWEAFTRGDIDAATEILDPDLRWYGASDPDAESACHSRTDARAFTRRALADGVSTELLDIDERTYVGDHEGDGVASNILGDPREAHYEAVPRVTYTDPYAGAVGAGEAPFSGTAKLAETPKMSTYTHAYAESNGLLTLLSDGERLTATRWVPRRGSACSRRRSPSAPACRSTSCETSSSPSRASRRSTRSR